MSQNDWGDIGNEVPREAIYREPEPNPGEKLPNGNLRCHGCCSEIPDNSAPGLLPSCPNCWAAVIVSQPQVAPRSDDKHPLRVPNAWWGKYVGLP